MPLFLLRHVIFWSVILLMAAEARAHEGRSFENSRISMKLKRKAFWSAGVGALTGTGTDARSDETLLGLSLTRHMELSPYREVRASLTGAIGHNSLALLTVGGAFLFPTNVFTGYAGLELGAGPGGVNSIVFGSKAVVGVRLPGPGGTTYDLGLTGLTLLSELHAPVVGAQVGLTF